MAYNAPVRDPKYWEGVRKRTARSLHRAIATKLCCICGKMICGGQEYYSKHSDAKSPHLCVPCRAIMDGGI